MAALVNSEMCSRVPVIVILGATGSGKSKLGIEIARRFGGEIVSADSMQAYKGLDIVTNKVTAEERAEATHHLLDMVTPPRPFSVVEFRDAALPIVERLLQQKKLPVVVGGTNYYIESLLWKVLVSPEPDIFPCATRVSESDGATGDQPTATVSQADSDLDVPSSRKAPTGTQSEAASTGTVGQADAGGSAGGDVIQADDGGGDGGAKHSNGETRGGGGGGGDVREALLPEEPVVKKARLGSDVESLSSPELHRRLQQVDPEMARSLHPNNRRRIIRSLEVFEQTGLLHSEVLKKQRQSEGGSALGGPLRYTHSAIFWLKCDQATLDARLDARVDDMIQRGLVAELLDFHQRYNAERLAENEEADYTTGIFQSIGFKEFHEYLLLAEGEREGERGRKMFEVAVGELKTVTRRYARKQVRWVVNRLLRQPQRQVPPVYAFDTSNPSEWEDLVYKPAVSVVEHLLKGKTPTDIKPLPLQEPLSNEPTSFHCEVCDRIFIGNIQWEAHIASKKHKKVLRQKAEAKKMKVGSTSPNNEEQEKLSFENKNQEEKNEG